jgi:catechol 2,3-dioxygenase-like lactoylglutathione lyase family enzyme
MKRFHVHVSVGDLQESIRFYSTLFGVAPARVEVDYAKWMLEDPFINFAISQRQAKVGVDHLGFQVEDASKLQAATGRLQAADERMIEQADAACCYAKSDKYWVTDPSGIAWETFHTLDSIPIFGADTQSGKASPLSESAQASGKRACCGPSSTDSASAGCCT